MGTGEYQALEKFQSYLSVLPHRPSAFTLRPALPEKKVADLSTLNEVGYQIRI